jgi:hypothetical protein
VTRNLFVKNRESDDVINRDKGTSDVGKQVVISLHAGWVKGVRGRI